MSQKRRWDTPEWAWEQTLIDAYDDYRWRQVLDPLAAAVRRWEAGEMDHVDLARAAGRVHKGVSPIDYIFGEKREMLVRMIEFDEEWSGPWIAAHPRPVQLAPREPGDAVQDEQGSGPGDPSGSDTDHAGGPSWPRSR